MEKKTERSNCHFAVQQASDGKPILVVQLYQDAMPILSGVLLGFDLLGGTQLGQAKDLAEMLNERVLDCFVTVKDKSCEVG